MVTKATVETTEKVTTQIETDDDIHEMDSRLANLIQAKIALKRRWNQQRTNRSLRKKIEGINREIEEHSKELDRQQWEQTCREADGRLHLGKAWRLLRHLLDKTQTKGEQQYKLGRIIHKAVAENREEEVKRRLDAKYFTVSPKENHPEYQGAENIEVDRDIEDWEVRNAMQDLNRRSVSGPDRVSKKALKNLNDAAGTRLTAGFNKCWRVGKLPRQWKEAKTTLIPKPQTGEGARHREPTPNIFNIVRGQTARARLNDQTATVPRRGGALPGFSRRLSKQARNARCHAPTQEGDSGLRNAHHRQQGNTGPGPAERLRHSPALCNPRPSVAPEHGTQILELHSGFPDRPNDSHLRRGSPTTRENARQRWDSAGRGNLAAAL